MYVTFFFSLAWDERNDMGLFILYVYIAGGLTPQQMILSVDSA